MSKPKIALWDLGNVIVRWEPETILASFNLSEKETDFLRRELLGHQDWLKLDQGLISETQFVNRLCNESTLSQPGIQRCFDVVRQSLTDIPESIAMVEQMRDAAIPMYVLSNMSHDNATYLRRREYFQWFDGVMISAEEKLIKPDPLLFRRLLSKYELKAEEVYFMDDSLANIEAAGSLGFQTHHFHRTGDCYRQIKSVFDLGG